MGETRFNMLAMLHMHYSTFLGYDAVSQPFAGHNPRKIVLPGLDVMKMKLPMNVLHILMKSSADLMTSSVMLLSSAMPVFLN